MEYKFVVDGVYYGKKRTLPSLNDYLHECNRNPHAGAKMKREFQIILCNKIRKQLKQLEITKPVILNYVFYESDKARDKSNIFAVAAKFIEDALQQCGVIQNDGWNEIEDFTHDFFIDKKNPRIEVTITEIEK